jgi:5-methylcytosine-specific restriction endonuclease McrA
VLKRQKVYDKFGGKCAYTGTVLKDDWQIDHLVPQFLFKEGYLEGDYNHLDNLVPAQKIINHYKRASNLEEFRTWKLGTFHDKLKKLPKKPKTEKSKKRILYMKEIAELFGITEDKPFSGVFYFEK